IVVFLVVAAYADAVVEDPVTPFGPQPDRLLRQHYARRPARDFLIIDGEPQVEMTSRVHGIFHRHHAAIDAQPRHRGAETVFALAVHHPVQDLTGAAAGENVMQPGAASV